MSKEMKDPAAAAKSRQRGLTVLERQAEAERIEAEKEAARRPRQAAKRSQSLPRTRPVADKEKDKHGGEQARGRGRQRINESGLRKDGGADVLQLQQRSKSLMSKKKWRRSMVVNTIGPAGGSVISGCPERSDARFEQGTAAGDVAHSEAVREWIKSNLSEAGAELPLVNQKDRKSDVCVVHCHFVCVCFMHLEHECVCHDLAYLAYCTGLRFLSL